MGLRIVAGAAGGRRLVAADGTRPTTERVREAVFSSLGDRVEGADVCDLWAGSGALGLEARSRGAASVVLVERDRRALAAIGRNVEAVALDGVTVRHEDVAVFCRHPRAGPFDLVLCDPPFALASDEVWARLEELRASGALAVGALVVLERDQHDPGTPPPWLAVERERSYGDALVRTLRVMSAGSAEGRDG
ncbi:16S rRNA (guanine(966)-N(2))-methyltransferase RsmD [Egibacter rhizosphaerae]|uniref:16S rRNA (Guanine(966)-N(2))-methyltransferase RsmD n=1 Tax=Egibacter rhizosphaerae TaxID=1670831 RepID=A0A411YCS1_9ACTN|nr:16S rRNA (guanine(966)-N(2))-methyltransferase RsmD [Egibacter rhizosphaerae]QBI18988.1 16S rRNA (guanine(966)-N(2))-methyltransferase RsmD [Egibacter rhizosphaerae]